MPRIAALLLSILIPAAFAQDFRGTISGQVTDETGAAIPGAKVRAIQRNTNTSIERETNADGFYSLPFLMPSIYDIEVTAQGFRTMRRANVELLTADKLDLPFRLQIGEVSHLSPLVDYADLDGNLLIANDPYRGVTVQKGKLILPTTPGLGLAKT